jgi:hypothetical protein
LALAALLGAIAAIEYTDRAGSGGTGANEWRDGADAGLLLPVPIDQVSAVELIHAGTPHRFERSSTRAWFYHGAHTGSEAAHRHEADQATAERIAWAFAAFGRTRIERRFPYDPKSRRYGVTAPGTVVLLYRTNEPRPFAQYAIGDVAPDTFSRYVLRLGGAEVVTIPNYQIENLLALIK